MRPGCEQKCWFDQPVVSSESTRLTMDALMAILPLVVGLPAATVAYGRSRLGPLTSRSSNRAALQPAS
jgi:hypothetical protein